MGVNGLTKLLKKRAPSSIKYGKMVKYSGSIVAVDAMLILYKYGIALGSNFMRKDGKNLSHLLALLFDILSKLNKKIFPYFIFDGKAPLMKKKILQERRNRKLRASKKLESKSGELSPSDKKKFFKRSFSINDTQIRECQQLLEYMGIPYIVSPGEADSQLAALGMVGLYVVTEDMDTAAFGTPIILRNFSNKKIVMEIQLKNILKELKLNYEQFVELCIILGTDYCPSIKGLGTIGIYDEYVKYKNMNKFINALKEHNKNLIQNGQQHKYIIPDIFEKNWIKVKKYYMQAKVYNPNDIKIVWKKPRVNDLYRFLIKENEFKKDVTLEKINELVKLYNVLGRKINQKIRTT